jgi:hypothetical protein
MKILNIKFLIIVAILFSSFIINAQTSSASKERIAEIKKWYAEIQTIGLKNCKTKKYVKLEGFNPESPKYSFDQNIQVCQINNNYQITKCSFAGYEWTQDVIIYRKKDKVFFVIIKGASEGYLYERRYYCNEDQKLIQQLDREGEGQLKPNNTEIKTDLYKSIKVVLADTFAEIESAIN